MCHVCCVLVPRGAILDEWIMKFDGDRELELIASKVPRDSIFLWSARMEVQRVKRTEIKERIILHQKNQGGLTKTGAEPWCVHAIWWTSLILYITVKNQTTISGAWQPILEEQYVSLLQVFLDSGAGSFISHSSWQVTFWNSCLDT